MTPPDLPDRRHRRARTATLRLRLLETTDVHGHLLPHDYFSGRDRQPWGLSRLATWIAVARAETANCLLFDNGDFLQGTPLSDLTAGPGGGWPGAHPVIAAMNRLGYDAATLGNHEFNFGLEHLRRSLAGAAFPVVCANVVGPGSAPLFPPWTLLHRRLTDSAGRAHALRIGVLGLVPPQVTRWDGAHLGGRATARCMIETARDTLPRLRAAGADLVVGLAHTGIDPGPDRPGMENAARALAGLGGIDALLLGHTHRRLPGSDHDGVDGVDAARGSVAGVPAVMAGSAAGCLGVLDLDLEETPQGWRVAAHSTRLWPAVSTPRTPRSVPRPVRSDRGLVRLLAPAHRATLERLARPVGESPVALHSYLSLVRGDDPLLRLTCAAQRAAATALLAGGPHDGLPLLSAAAPFRAGGRAGPQHYTDVPAGQVCLRHVADIYVFPNTLTALRLTGAEIADRLERAVSGYALLSPGRRDQQLRDPGFAGHECDMIDGLTYEIDLSVPPRYTPDGRPRQTNGPGRIRALQHDGKPLDPRAEFVLVTNNYRTFGGGPFPAPRPDSVILRETTTVQAHLSAFLSGLSGTAELARAIGLGAPPVWRFAPLAAGTGAIFDTGPGVRDHPHDIAALGAEDMGDTTEGFARFLLHV